MIACAGEAMASMAGASATVTLDGCALKVLARGDARIDFYIPPDVTLGSGAGR